MRDVRRAGEALRGDLIWTDDTAESIREVFRVANNWRDSHAYPMNRMRYELGGQIRRCQISGGITVARLKRMPSVRRKLRKISSHLNQIQDLAGCRAVLPTMDDVRSVIASLRTSSKHELHREDDYIQYPKIDGYRCHHMIFKFKGDGGESVYNDRRVEIQLRTQLQHSWATAVEAVGMFRREDMKAGQGDAAWLRLFTLMSAEFMAEEGVAPPDDNQGQRHKEISDLNSHLGAIQVLEDLRQAVRITEDYAFDPRNKPDYFLIRYDRETRSVTVSAQFGPIYAVQSYDRAESIDPIADNSQFNSVLVEVDEIENLKTAYPNYFGEVGMFRDRLIRATGGDPSDFHLPPQPRAPSRPKEKPDMSWLHTWKRWK